MSNNITKVKSYFWQPCFVLGYQEQMDRIKEGCNLLIATPGRLIDFVEKNIVSLAKVRY